MSVVQGRAAVHEKREELTASVRQLLAAAAHEEQTKRGEQAEKHTLADVRQREGESSGGKKQAE